MPTTLERYDGMIHGFVSMRMVFPEADDAVTRIAEVLQGVRHHGPERLLACSSFGGGPMRRLLGGALTIGLFGATAVFAAASPAAAAPQTRTLGSVVRSRRSRCLRTSA